MASTSEENNPTVVVDMENLVNNMKYNIGTIGEKPKNREGCKIRRVYDLVRKEGELDYNPNVISIGPLHDRNSEALKPMEELKWRCLRLLLHRNPESNTVEKYLDKVNSVKEEAMKFYLDEKEMESELEWELEHKLKLDASQFVLMMVLDGCFLIEYLVLSYCGENHKLLHDLNYNPTLLWRDLLLIENQIPFFILECLFDSSDIPDLGRSVTLMELVVSYVTTDRYGFNSSYRSEVHLLHVYHACLCPTPINHGKPHTLAKKMRRIKRLAAAPFLFLLSCLLTCKIPANFFRGHHRQGFNRNKGFNRTRVPTGISSASQLYNSGVNFKNKKGKGSFVEATFDKYEGILEIPIFLLDETKISTFRNLIAFELMYPKAGNHITSHAALMSSLIRTAEDVAILKDNRIIHSNLKDVHVVELFYQLYKHLNIDFKNHPNRQLFTDVSEYCSASHNKWRADFKHTYFGSPWTTASLIAATFILLLTSAQTFYTIYTYHHPPS